MSRVIRSARGELVDFDKLKMVYEATQAAQNPRKKASTVLVHDENFLNARIAAAESKKALVAAMAQTAPTVEQIEPVVTEEEPVRKIIKKESVKNA